MYLLRDMKMVHIKGECLHSVLEYGPYLHKEKVRKIESKREKRETERVKRKHEERMAFAKEQVVPPFQT